MLIFGCAGKPASQKNGTIGGGIELPQVPGITHSCEPSYQFGQLTDGVLSKSSELIATVECAGGETFAVNVGGTPATTTKVVTNDSQQVRLKVPALKDGTVKVAVDSGGKTLFSKDWKVKPLGSEDAGGLDTDAVSFKEWRTMAVDVENEVTVSGVRAYVKRLEWKTQPGTVIVIELSADSGGSPGEPVATVEKPINATTLTDNWVNFEFVQKHPLAPGRYWLTLKIKQSENVNLVSDVLQVHYTTLDKQKPGNDYTREMKLSVDEKTGKATETQWQPLPYDKMYSLVLTAQ
jgi:hypothetical protein